MITVKNLVQQYGDRRALDQVSTTFPAEQTTVILGPSGSGKSTLLRTLNLLAQPTSGTLTIYEQTFDLSQPLTAPKLLAVRQHFGMVFQEKALFTHLTVLKNLTQGPIKVKGIPADQATAQATNLLTQFDMAALAPRYPYQLSGGQQQRVAILRALAMQPDYLLLDEPTSALDPELEAQVLRVLRDLANQKKSIVIVTHNLAFAQAVADKIIFMEDGKIGYDGPSTGFFQAQDPRIQRFLNAMTF